MGAQDDLAVTFDHLDLRSRSVQSELTPDRRGNSDDPTGLHGDEVSPRSSKAGEAAEPGSGLG